jgi:BON domain
MQLVHEDFVVREINRDEIIAQTLVEWYGRRPSLGSVHIAVMNGTAVLRGEVATERDRALAIELALDAGADEVQDELMLTWPLAA